MKAVKKKATKSTTWKVTVLWVSALIMVVFGFAWYQYKTAGWDFSALSASFTRIKTWVNDHKSKPHLEAKLKSVNTPGPDKPLHFEFYTALPNMQLAEPPVKTETRPVELKQMARSLVSAKTNLIKTNTAIVTADELERELSGHLKLSNHVGKEQFAIQVGVFRTVEAAKHYQDTLRKTGFKAMVAPLSTDKKDLYRVQLGPYADKDQASLSRRQLQTQGISGVIYKLNK